MLAVDRTSSLLKQIQVGAQNVSVQKNFGAMTGEISLSGAVLPVGGIKEKIIAAHTAGCRAVIVPHRNAGDLAKVPLDTQRELNVLTVEKVEEVLKALLGPLPLRHTSKSRSDIFDQNEEVLNDEATTSSMTVHIGRQDARGTEFDPAVLQLQSSL